MASHYLSAAASPPDWDCDARPRTRSSASTDGSYPEEGLQQQQQQQGGGWGPRARNAAGHSSRRKIGRPIAYTGDPDSEHLTDAERRRIKRRIANRESARRVRRKRQDALEDMQERLEQVQGHAHTLSSRLQQADRERTQLVRQLREAHQRAHEATEAAAAQQEAEPAAPDSPAAAGVIIPKPEPGLDAADAGLLFRSSASIVNNMLSGGGGGAITTGGRVRDGPAPSAGLPPQGGGMQWYGGAVAANNLPKPRQPMFVAVTPATAHTRVQCFGGKPASAPPPPAPGVPLLDLQSMSSADDPLDCFVGMPARPWEEPAHLPESEWRV